ncbi:hypothetical protein O7634_29095 [Micromonospora sp. WMMD1120]|uniref:hypothetical protein n=1 Tax=Micromonospora sp. WMMD1120 TaxID=3016106 RepID=UPI0024169DC7|nr:hypothetical protein [Micromonospora sp. WMMD1120]MDG4810833.1 hypothetical protein [Micromonospora sp. WMMD1120]
MAYLAIVDRGYRGSVEAQFFDALYGVRMFASQLGGIDLLLRGTSVTAALQPTGDIPRIVLGSEPVAVSADPRAAITGLVGTGTTVYVDAASLAGLGLDDEPVLPGCAVLDSTELAVRWAAYEQVWFL